jgi:phage shock protein PspC (stress-responsive transcriptional regulator)
MEPKRLYRSRTDRMVSGVCGGLAQYFTIDVTLVRLIFLLLLVFGGGGFLIYIVLAIIVPEEGTTAGNPQEVIQSNAQDFADRARELGQGFGTNHMAAGNRQGALLVGGVLIAVGILFLVQNILRINFSQFWPLLLIVIGIALLVPQFRKS